MVYFLGSRDESPLSCHRTCNADGVWRFRAPTDFLLDGVLVQRIARRTDRPDDVAVKAFVQGLAQAADMYINGADFDVAVMAPDAIEQALTRKDMAWIFEEMLEQPVSCVARKGCNRAFQT